MGKTIQTLALIATDKSKPNLIVAYVTPILSLSSS